MKLSTLETISELKPIEGADAIEIAVIGGWECVVKKNEFEVNEICIYVPPDTLVDTDKSHFAFLASKNKSNLVRIKPTKIRGVWSEGLLLKICNLPQEVIDHSNDFEFDFGEILGVSKYNKDVILTQMAGNGNQKIASFPTDIISKTDEDSLKNNKKVINEFMGKEIYISKKMDGSSMTLILNNDIFTVCSRNLILEDDAIMYQYVIKEKIEERLRSLKSYILSLRTPISEIYSKDTNELVKRIYNKEELSFFTENHNMDNYNVMCYMGLKDKEFNCPNNIAIQGEFAGNKINGNKMGLNGYAYYIFNIKNLDTNTYYGLDDLKYLCNILNLKLVPILFEGPCDETFDMDYFKNMANNIKYREDTKQSVHGEGIVIRPINPIYSHILHKNLSCKVINQNYKD
jgi:RNA ligase (TIGR02306 family)